MISFISPKHLFRFTQSKLWLFLILTVHPFSRSCVQVREKFYQVRPVLKIPGIGPFNLTVRVHITVYRCEEGIYFIVIIYSSENVSDDSVLTSIVLTAFTGLKTCGIFNGRPVRSSPCFDSSRMFLITNCKRSNSVLNTCFMTIPTETLKSSPNACRIYFG